LIDIKSLLMLFSSTLFLCYFSGLIYTKTKIPDAICLLVFGILLGPVLGYFKKEIFISLSPLMGVVAICIITFDSGIGVDVRLFIKTLPKSFALTIAMFFAAVSLVGSAVSLLLPESFTLLEGMLLGTMVAGISTVAVRSMLDGLQRLIPNLESTKALLVLESTLCDPIRFVAAITIIRMIMLPGGSIKDSLRDIVYTFVVASIIGLALGLTWAEILDRLRGRPLNYMLTMAVLFPTYLLAESVAGGGGGTLTTFIFGFVLANYRYVAKRLGSDRNARPDKQRIIEFNEEISFFLKSYYFVYIVATGIGRLMSFSREEKVISRLVFTLGTSTIVMSQLPSIFDPRRVYFLNPEVYSDLCFPILLGTLIIATIAGPTVAKWELTGDAQSEARPERRRRPPEIGDRP
jgi:NhaP-type Na+/H+ or K+/H+ antiporter